MPKKETIHIQKIAPGPPDTIAADTPAILPVPTVAASAVHKLWNWEIERSPFSVCAVTVRSENSAPIVFRNQCLICVSWKKPVRNVIMTPVPISSTSIGTPQTKPFTALLMFSIKSRNPIRNSPLIKLCKTLSLFGNFYNYFSDYENIFKKKEPSSLPTTVLFVISRLQDFRF